MQVPQEVAFRLGGFVPICRPLISNSRKSGLIVSLLIHAKVLPCSHNMAKDRIMRKKRKDIHTYWMPTFGKEATLIPNSP